MPVSSMSLPHVVWSEAGERLYRFEQAAILAQTWDLVLNLGEAATVLDRATEIAQLQTQLQADRNSKG